VHARRRRRLLFMLGRYAVVIAIILLVAWLTGGFWLRGFAIVATLLLLLRLGVFFWRGRHLEDRIRERAARGPRRRWRA
jgi:fatty acid desaturase